MKRSPKPYYPQLEIEILRRGILKRDMREKLGVNHTTFSQKINGKHPFTLEQGLSIWRTWFADVPIEELFSHN